MMQNDMRSRPIADEAAGRCVESAPLATAAPVSVFDESLEPVLRKGILSIFDQAVVSGANFLTTVIIARACSPAGLGVYALAWTIVLFMAVAQTNLITIPYTMYLHRREGGSLAEYGGSAICHQFVLSAAAVVCFLGLAIMLSFGLGPNGLKPAAWILAGAVPFILLRDFARRFSFAHLRPEIAIIMDVSATILQIAGLLVLWNYGMLTAATAYAVMGATCAVTAIGWWFFRKQPVRFSKKTVIADWRKNWTFSRWAITGQVTGLVFYALPWLLAYIHGEAETGRLAACTTLVGLSNLFVMGLNNFVMPKAAHACNRDGAGALGRVLCKATLASACVLGGLCVAVFFVGNSVAGLIFGPTYADSGILLTVLAVAALLDSIGQTAGAGIWALDRPAANLAARFGSNRRHACRGRLARFFRTARWA